MCAPIRVTYKNVNLIIYLCFNMYSALRIDFVFTLRLMTYNKTLLNEYSYRWMWTLWTYSVIYTIKYRVLNKRKYSTLIIHSSIVALPFALTNSPTNIVRTLALKYIFVLCIICTAFFGTLFMSRDAACLFDVKDYWGRDERSLSNPCLRVVTSFVIVSLIAYKFVSEIFDSCVSIYSFVVRPSHYCRYRFEKRMQSIIV